MKALENSLFRRIIPHISYKFNNTNPLLRYPLHVHQNYKMQSTVASKANSAGTDAGSGRSGGIPSLKLNDGHEIPMVSKPSYSLTLVREHMCIARN